MRRWRWFVFFAPAIAVTACDTAQRVPAVASTVRDSNGIRIIESPVPVARWEVSPKPELEIGVASGDPAYEFGSIGWVIRLADGRVAVAESQANEIRFFGDNGRHLSTAGRTGAGPGEYRRLQLLLHYRGDSILAYDGRGRVSLLDEQGRYGRSFVPRLFGVRILGSLADGSFIGGIDTSTMVQGAQQFQMRLLRILADSSAFKTIAVVHWFWNYTYTHGGTDRSTSLPLAPVGTVTPGYNEIHVNDGSAFDIRTYSPDGALQRILRLSGPLQPVTRELLSEVRTGYVGSGADMTERDRVFDAFPIPETVPTYTELRLDDTGSIWARHFTLPGEVMQRWTVFGVDGAAVAQVEFEEALRVTQFGRDFVLGVVRDENEVQYVRVHRLARQVRR